MPYCLLFPSLLTLIHKFQLSCWIKSQKYVLLPHTDTQLRKNSQLPGKKRTKPWGHTGHTSLVSGFPGFPVSPGWDPNKITKPTSTFVQVMPNLGSASRVSFPGHYAFHKGQCVYIPYMIPLRRTISKVTTCGPIKCKSVLGCPICCKLAIQQSGWRTFN